MPHPFSGIQPFTLTGSQTAKTPLSGAGWSFSPVIRFWHVMIIWILSLLPVLKRWHLLAVWPQP